MLLFIDNGLFWSLIIMMLKSKINSINYWCESCFVEEVKLTQQDIDTILPEIKKASLLEKSSWFMDHSKPDIISEDVHTYMWHGSEIVVAFDSSERQLAIDSCKDSYQNTRSEVWWLNQEVRNMWCDSYAYNFRNTEVRLTDVWATIDLSKLVDSAYTMIAVIENEDYPDASRILIDPCNDIENESWSWFKCLFPNYEQFVRTNGWMTLEYYPIDSYMRESIYEAVICDDMFECWRCQIEDSDDVFLQYCPTGPTTHYYWKKLGDSIIAYVESDKGLLQSISVESSKVVKSNMTFDEVLVDGSLNFATYAYAAKNDSERRTLSESWKTIQWFFSPSLTIDPADEFYNSWESVLFECGDDCDVWELAKEYALTTREVCELNDGLHHYPLELTWNEKWIYSYAIHKMWNILTYAVLIPEISWSKKYSERYIYEYDCSTNIAEEIADVTSMTNQQEWMNVLYANNTIVYLQKIVDECILNCSTLTELIEYSKSDDSYSILDVFKFDGGEKFLWNIMKYSLQTIERYYGEWYEGYSIWNPGELVLNIWGFDDKVSWSVVFISTKPNDQWVYIKKRLNSDIVLNKRSVYPATF